MQWFANYIFRNPHLYIANGVGTMIISLNSTVAQAIVDQRINQFDKKWID